MKAPYQIKREGSADDLRMLFLLVDTRTDTVVRRAWAAGKSLFGPTELRVLQGRLNTAAMLDGEHNT